MYVKKAISTLLVAVMIISLIPGGKLRVNAATYGDLTYTVLNEEVAITRCSQFASGSIHIPSELEGYPVTRIYGDAFINCTKVTRIYIPSSVVKIESGAFSWINNLQGIYVDENNQNYCSENGILFNKNKTILLRAPRTLTEYVIPNSVTQIGSGAFNGCINLNNVIIGDNVTNIGSSAFYECTSLVSITIPDSVRTIEGSAFYRCTNLSDVKFGNSLTTIEDYAFYYCYALTSISLPDSVTDINRAFNQCTGLTSIDIGHVKTLDYRALCGCSELSSITIGSSFTRVGSNAFEGCKSLINVYYYGTEEQWQNITISDGNFYLEERATIHYVHDCQWDEGTVTTAPSCVPGVKTYACTWPGCAETITESIPAISDHTYGLWTSIDIETHQRTCVCGDTEIAEHIWDKAVCTETRTCTLCGETSQGHIWVEPTCTTPKTCIICNSTEGNPVHTVVGEICSSCNRYGTCGENLTWSLDDAGVLTISGAGAMSDYNYNTIPWYSIKDSIKSVVLSNGVSRVGNNAFYECLELSSVSVPATVNSIGEWAFYFCRFLTEINLPNSITSIEDYAFRCCMNIVSVRLPDSVSTIGNGAFSYCIALESINIPDAVTAINQSTFADSRNLKNVTIGKGVTKIWSSAFEDCSSLESINIPTTVNMIQSSAFKGCSKLTTVIYCGTTTQWEAIQFINSNSILLGCERIQHSWIDATCLLPKICEFCGLTEGTVTEHIFDNACDSTCNICGMVRTVTHSYGEWITDKEATCAGTGRKSRVCTVCGETEMEEIPLVDHDYEAVVTAPTCTEQGFTTYSCVNCGDSYVGDYVDALGHTEVIDAAVAATCIAAGLTEGKHCSVCEEVLVEQNVAPATGHSFAEWLETLEATCITQGMERRECANCEHFEEQTIAALGHALVQHEAKTPACTEVGWSSYESCEHCEYSTYEEIPATGHNYEAVVTEPTWESGGYTTHTCVNCGDSYVDSYTDPLPYEPGDADGDGEVNTDDAIYLLYNVMFGDGDYPVTQECDFDGNGEVNTDDAIYLLYHVMFGGEDYPLH